MNGKQKAMFDCTAEFVRWNQTIFRKQRRGLPLGDGERRLLREGLLRFHPKLVGVAPHRVGPVVFRRNRVSGHFVWCTTIGGRRETLNRKCAVKSGRQRLNAALRDAVRDQVDRLRRRGEEVDHAGKGFSALVTAFLRAQGLTVEDAQPAITKRDMFDDSRPASRRRFYDVAEPLNSKWRQYHQTHARLESVPRHEHRRRTTERRLSE